VDFRRLLRSSVILTVVMIGLLFLGLAVGANVGPVEFFVWLAVFVIGLILCAAGSRKRSDEASLAGPAD